MDRVPAPPADARLQSKVFNVGRITVKQDRIVFEVQVSNLSYRYTNTHLIEKVCTQLPHLFAHTCKNSQGPTFAAVMKHTSLPHLLEHMIIELQAKNAADTTELYVGTSEWVDEQAGLARIEVSFADDLDALRAFHSAIAIIDWAMI